MKMTQLFSKRSPNLNYLSDETLRDRNILSLKNKIENIGPDRIDNAKNSTSNPATSKGNLYSK